MRKKMHLEIRKPKIHILLIFITLLASCGRQGHGTNDNVSKDSISADKYYTDLFDREGEGYTGGDGTYSVELPDGKTAWIFGDSFLGGVNPDNSRTRQIPMYIRNSVVVQDGDSMKTYYSRIDGKKASFAIPPVVLNSNGKITEDSIWYWPGDAYMENGDFHLFLSEFTQTDTGMWDFQWKDTWLAIYDYPGFHLKSITRLPQGKTADVHFGHAVFPGKEYTYVYGAGKGKPHVARYPAGNFKGEWEYYTGTSWSDNPEETGPMADISGSEQFSVFRHNGRYIMITQMGGLSDEICSFTSTTPFGPWGNQELLYKTPIPDSTDNLFTYNALAHPHLTRQGELLISYNMNSMVLADHFKNADIYRPRFIRVPLKMIEK